ncbi:MAG: hypothetical protein CME63_16860 [Halobacteriovoraceae bacterium]|nr:hypothetical protein [Halobacteriovoraceae bacterium]MBC99417.1 hypothetical protein [Halobacteriovoraceae bacterium]
MNESEEDKIKHNIEEALESSREKNSFQEAAPTATRKSLQLPRRLFHCSMGLGVGLVYQFLLTHSRAIYILGFCACVVYILEQVRINYPGLGSKVKIINKYLFRAEEQLKESAGVPYVMGILLTLISFPKVVALIAIYTLAVADPLSAIIGIRYGRTKITEHKSLQGSGAFFLSCFTVSFLVFYWASHLSGQLGDYSLGPIILCSFLIALTSSLFELIPLKLDDNLTIPLFTAFISLIYASLLSIPL